MRRAVIAVIILASGGAAFAGPTLVAVELERPADAYALVAAGVAVVEARPGFALAFAEPGAMAALDNYRYADLGPPPGPVYLAWPRPGAELPRAEGVTVLARFGDTYVVAGAPAAVEKLATLGAELKRVSGEPLKAPRKAALPEITYDPAVAELVGRVRAGRYFDHIEKLAAISTRYSHAEEIAQATAYIEDHFKNLRYETTVLPYEYDPMANEYLTDCVFRPGGKLGWLISFWGYVWRTDDYGESWTYHKSEGKLDHGYFMTDRKGFVVGGKAYLGRTDDGGRTWTQLPLEDPDDYLRDVYFHGQMLGVAGGEEGLIYRTTDGGATWNKVATPTNKLILGVYAQSADNWWALGMDGLVMRSYDGGATWTKKNVPQTEGFGMRRMAFADATHAVIVGNEGTILFSEDAGETWRRVSGYFPEWPFFTEVAFADATRGWAAGSGGCVYRTDDAGATWKLQNTRCPEYYTFTGISPITRDEVWVAGGPSAVIHTDDGGAHWEKVEIKNAQPVIWNNVEAVKKGFTRPDEVYVLCGHYDAISEDPWNRAPGAEDNASGVAGVLEAATVMADRDFDCTVKFLAFSGEEEGLLGSRAYAREEYREGADIRGVFNMDMISYLDDATHDIEVRYNDFSQGLLDVYRDVARFYVPSTEIYPVTEGRGGSDHEPFWEFGYPALLSIEYAGKQFYPWYHMTTDLPEHLTPAFGADVTRVNVAAAAVLARARSGAGTSSEVAAYPNPAKPSSGHDRIRFANVAAGSMLRLFDVAGAEVWRTTAETSGVVEWPLATAGGDAVASGVYVFVVEDEGGGRRSGKVAVIK